MISANDILSKLTKEDWDRIKKDIGKKMLEEKRQKQKFYKSKKCKHIIDRIIATGKGFDNDDPFYHYDDIVKTFQFVNVSEEDFRLFFNVISCTKLGEEDISEASHDEDNPWPNFNHVKRGLYVSVMIGQGSSIYVRPAGEQ